MFASSLGILLLRIVIIFSTGLLVLTPTTMFDKNVGLKTDSKIVAFGNPQSQTDEPIMEYYGILNHELDYPYGTTDSVAYETIDLSSTLPNSSITATVAGFFPHFDCQVSQSTSNLTWSSVDEFEYLEMNVTSQSSICPPFSGLIEGLCDPRAKACLPQAPLLQVDANSVHSQPWYNSPLPDTDPCAIAWRFVFAEVLYQRNESSAANSSLGWNVEARNLSAVMCAVSYSIQPVNVTIDVTGVKNLARIFVTEPTTRTAKLLDGLSISDFNSLLVTDFIEIANQLPISYCYTSDMCILSLQNGNSSVDAFRDPKTLGDTANRAFEGIGVQVANIYLRSPQQHTLTGTAISKEQRLQVRLLSVCVMSAALVLLIMCLVVVFIFRPQNVISRNPNSIATNAAILASSVALNDAITDTRRVSGKQVYRHVHESRVQSRVSATPSATLFSVDIAPVVERGTGGLRDSGRKPALGDTTQGLKWWRPLSMTFPFMVLAGLLPFSVIVVLEILQRLSDARQGIANVSLVSASGREAGSLLSSLVMTITAMTYKSIEFAVATLAPCRSLRRGSATTRSFLKNNMGQLTIPSIIRSLMDHDPGVALASLAAVIGSLLTIFASGLYTIEPAPFVSHLDIIGADRFINKWNGSNDNGALAVFTLIGHENASYPEYTFDEVALPIVQVSSDTAINETVNSYLQVSLPARRASLNCTVVPQANTTISTVNAGDAEYPQWTIQVMWTAGVPDSCKQFRNQSNDVITSIPFSATVFYENSINESILDPFDGGILDSNSFSGPGPYASGIGASSNGPSCPSLAFFFGYFMLNSTSSENITAMTCVQGLEEIETNVTFVLPDMTIPADLPPVVNETSAKWIVSEDYVGTMMQGGYFDLYPSNYDSSLYLDGFIETVLYGTEGIPANELLGPSSADRLVDAVQHVYRKYMAQVINLNMREPIANDTSKPSYRADMLDGTHHFRLKQNNESKIILQTLLGVMGLCSMVVYWACFDMRYTLQQCPWSMARVMSLLAGSEICERRIMPEGAEFMNDKELEAALQGWQFSLGWWETQDAENEGSSRFGIGVGRSEGTGYRRGPKA